MISKDKLDKLDVKVAILKQKAENKNRVTQKEREDIKEKIKKLSDNLAELLEDSSISFDTKKALEKETRKQMVLINKVLEDLEQAIQISRKIAE